MAPAEGFNTLEITAGTTINRFGVSQIIESIDSLPMRSRNVIAQLIVKPLLNAGNGNMNIRIALLEWQGTSDAVVRDVVNDWDNYTYTEGNFFITSPLKVIATAQISAVHNSWSLLSVTGTVSSECNNLILFVWITDAPVHANDKLQLSEAGIYDGITIRNWLPRHTGSEELLCHRFCYAIKLNASGDNGIVGIGRGAFSTTEAEIILNLPTVMRVIPTLTAIASDWQLSDGVNAPITLSNLSIGNISTAGILQLNCTVVSGLVQYRTYALLPNGNNKLMYLSSEI